MAANVKSKATVDANLQKVITRFAGLAEEASNTQPNGLQTRWFRPPVDPEEGWSGALLTADDLIAIHRAFETDEAEENLINVYKPSAPGTVGDGVVLTLQIDYMAQAERAFRARTTQSFPRSVAHLSGRHKGHGKSTGVFLNQTMKYFTSLITQGSQ
jgi:hypothetical protein